jgi:hypothetical protein
MEHMTQQSLAQLITEGGAQLLQPDVDAGLQGTPHQHQSQERQKILGEREMQMERQPGRKG